MQKRPLQRITLKLSDLEEYEVVRRRNKTRQAIEALEAGRASSVTVTATETAPSSSSDTTSETPCTQRDMLEHPPVVGWRTAEIANSNTNSGSTEDDDTSVAAVADDTDTIAELSDDGWVDIDEEDGARGGEP